MYTYTRLNMTLEFPRIPTGPLKRHIADEADARLAFYLPTTEAEQQAQPPEVQKQMASRPKLPVDIVDAPLVRLYNFLRSYFPLVFAIDSWCHRGHVAVLSAGDTLVSGRSWHYLCIHHTQLAYR